MTKFTYDIENGEFVNKYIKPEYTVLVTCSNAIIEGRLKRRMYDEWKDCFYDVEAFYFIYNGVEYGILDMTSNQFLIACRVGACGVGTACPPDKVYECAYDDQYL